MEAGWLLPQGRMKTSGGASVSRCPAPALAGLSLLAVSAGFAGKATTGRISRPRSWCVGMPRWLPWRSHWQQGRSASTGGRCNA